MDKIKKLFLGKKTKIEICYKGFLIRGYADLEKPNFKLRTTVFSEKNYIPLSIRGYVEKILKSSKIKKFPAYLEIDEENYSVDLVQEVPILLSSSISKLVKIFVFVARSWAPLLKHIAKQDLENV
jgi:hypothetical protein